MTQAERRVFDLVAAGLPLGQYVPPGRAPGYSRGLGPFPAVLASRIARRLVRRGLLRYDGERYVLAEAGQAEKLMEPVARRVQEPMSPPQLSAARAESGW